jgi:hypothetical protein
MDPRLAALVRRQLEAGFPDLRGARADVTLPISDRLLNEAISEVLPASAPVRDLKLTSRPGNRIRVRCRIAAASFLPPINLTLLIERQPQLPASPILVLKLETAGLLSFAGSALRFLEALPPGVWIEQDRIHVDLSALLAERGLAGLLEFAEQVHVTTTEGALVIAIRAVVDNSECSHRPE